jgi:hypothetical protein
MRILAPLLVLVLLLCASARAADAPVLGSPEFYANGVGFGTVAPRTIHNGGDPSGYIGSIRWAGWGRTVAHGVGKGNIFRPMGGYYPPVRVRLRVRDLGTCPGHPERAYTTFEARYPQWPGGPLGSWFKWSGSNHTMCDDGIDYDSASPGACRSVAGTYRAGAVMSIAVYKLSCARARQVAARIRRWARPPGCEQHGCRTRVLGLKCHLDRVHGGESAGFEHPRRVQRLACRDGAPSLSAFLVLNEAA